MRPGNMLVVRRFQDNSCPRFSLENLKKEITLMTAVGNVPYLVWDMMTTRSWHKTHHNPLKLPFYPKKELLRPKTPLILTINSYISITYLGSTPTSDLYIIRLKPATHRHRATTTVAYSHPMWMCLLFHGWLWVLRAFELQSL